MSHPSIFSCYRRITNTVKNSTTRPNQANQNIPAQQSFSSCMLHPMPIITLVCDHGRCSPNLCPCTQFSALIGFHQLDLNLASSCSRVNGKSEFVGQATSVEKAQFLGVGEEVESGIAVLVLGTELKTAEGSADYN